jgi:hypothetical protein
MWPFLFLDFFIAFHGVFVITKNLKTRLKNKAQGGFFSAAAKTNSKLASSY